MNEAAHVSVLLEESVQALAPRSTGCYLDATFGRGGHSRRLLECIGAQGRVLALDQDADAEQVAQQLQAGDTRFCFRRCNFSDLDLALQGFGVMQVDGVLFDLGVSSPQLDQAHRGFSFRKDGPLDMRMDATAVESAASWIARASEAEIADVIWRFGEERYSRRMARAITSARAKAAITRTGELAEIIAQAHPRWPRDRHPATRAFQAIRIHVNRELQALPEGLHKAFSALRPQGRLAVISFHSLEDRLVKNFMRDLCSAPVPPRGVPLPESAAQQPCAAMVIRKQRPGEREMRCNPRARSATLRVVEKRA